MQTLIVNDLITAIIPVHLKMILDRAVSTQHDVASRLETYSDATVASLIDFNNKAELIMGSEWSVHGHLLKFNAAAICTNMLSRLPDNELNNVWFSETIGIHIPHGPSITDEGQPVAYVIHDHANPKTDIIITHGTTLSSNQSELRELIRRLNKYMIETHNFTVKMPKRISRIKLNDYTSLPLESLMSHVSTTIMQYYRGCNINCDNDNRKIHLGDSLIVQLTSDLKLIEITLMVKLSEFTTYPKLNTAHQGALMAFIYLTNFKGDIHNL